MIEIYQAKARTVQLDDYCHLSQDKYMNLVEWQNGEGFDLELDGHHLALTWGQLEALQVLAHYKG